MLPPLKSVPPAIGRILGGYFRSGWAFLVPYVVAYLLYAWLKWPVHSANSAGETGQLSRGFQIPLLHLYWTLHFLHLACGTIALRAWWRGKQQSGSRSTVEHLLPLLPWALLGLLFWTPGIYLEFPADPWQHYARTTEWGWHGLVTQHTTWTKSSYFLAYSFIGNITPPLRQLRGFDVYYTACCLLLCWQYYRLARAIGLSERASTVFVLLQTLLFGNNLFGFYRYYGMSSSVFAQIGAVAATRLALEVFGAGILPRTERSDGPPASSHPDSLTLGAPGHLFPPLGELLKLGITLAALLPVIAFNHVQGLMIAAIGIAAVTVWRLIAWRRAMIGWLALGGLALSIAAILWWPKHPLLDQAYRPYGWMTAWYGFNLVAPSSPGFQRAWVMIGALGGLNLAAGVWLVARNHIVGWLTLMPLLVLSLPFIAIPFANQLAAQNNYIITFHRPLFAIPAGLAMVALIAKWNKGTRTFEPRSTFRAVSAIGLYFASIVCRHQRKPIVPGILCSPFAILLLSTATFVALPANGPSFNRFYNLLMVPPADLMMMKVLAEPALRKLQAAQKPLRQIARASRVAKPSFDPRSSWARTDKNGPSIVPRLVTSPSLSYVAIAGNIAVASASQKRLLSVPPYTRSWIISELKTGSQRGHDTLFVVPSSTTIYTTISFSAQLSDHWLPQEVAIDRVSTLGLTILARAKPWRMIESAGNDPCFVLGTWDLTWNE